MIIEVLDDDVLGTDGNEPLNLTRVFKGRPKKDAQREAFKRSSDVLFADKVTVQASGGSWWLGLTDRESFARQAAVELERMQTSKFGRMKGNIPEAPVA